MSVQYIAGSGAYNDGAFEFSFDVGQWVYTLVGRYDPYTDELAGSWYVDGERAGAWQFRR